MIDDALKKFKKAEFEKFESEVSLARLIPFLFVTESIGVGSYISVDYFQDISCKEMKEVNKLEVDQFIARTSFA